MFGPGSRFSGSNTGIWMMSCRFHWVSAMWSGYMGNCCAPVEGRADIKSLEMPKIAPHPPLFSSLLSFRLPSSSRPISLFFPSYLSASHLPPHPLFIHTPFLNPSPILSLISSPPLLPQSSHLFSPPFTPIFFPISLSTFSFLPPFSSALILPVERSPSLLLYFSPLTPSSSSPHHYLCLFVPKHRRSIHL